MYPLYSPYRLVIDCVRVPAAAPRQRMTDKVLGRVLPRRTDGAPEQRSAPAAAKHAGAAAGADA